MSRKLIPDGQAGWIEGQGMPAANVSSTRTEVCECCGQLHSYPIAELSPGNQYYDLCRKCAVENEYEPEHFDWRTQTQANFRP